MILKLCKIVLCLIFVLCQINEICSESICNGGHGDLLPDPKSCSNFYQCVWGKPVKKNCSPGLHFDNVLKVCNWPYSAGCVVSQNTPTSYVPPKKPVATNICNGKNNALVPDPYSNYKYYLCFWGKPMLMQCKSGLVFDPIFKICKKLPTRYAPVTNKNLLNPNPNNICEGKHGDLLPDPQSCSNFYQCVWYKPVLKICPTSLHFDNVLKVCNWPRDAGCSIKENIPTSTTTTTTSTTTSTTKAPTTEIPVTTINPFLPPNICEGLHGNLLPDPETCTNFYVCVSSIPILMHCPSGLHFDIFAKFCNWPNLAGCSIESSTSTTESSLPSTTEIEMDTSIGVDTSTLSDKITDFSTGSEISTDFDISTTELNEGLSTELESTTSLDISTEDNITTDSETSIPIETSTESQESTPLDSTTGMEETTTEEEETTLLETTATSEVSTLDDSSTPMETTTGMEETTTEDEETTLLETTATSEVSTLDDSTTPMDTTTGMDEIATETATSEASTVVDLSTESETTLSSDKTTLDDQTTNSDTTIIDVSTESPTTANIPNDICSPDDTDAFVKDPDNCHKYYKCDNGNAEQFTCPHDWHFSPVLVGCFTQWLSDCDNTDYSDFSDVTPIIF